MDASPAKRRVLGSLDINTSSPASKPAFQHSKPKTSSLNSSVPSTAAENRPPSQLDSKKRPCMSSSSEQPAKKPCPGSPSSTPMDDISTDGLLRPRSTSPAPSSVFDSSAVDTTQGTAVTEPDNDVPALAPAPRRVPTREESRQKAEILRVRLGLANYKLRTGQADVQFAQLRMLGPDGAPLAPRLVPAAVPPLSSAASCSSTSSGAVGRPRKRTPLPTGPVARTSSQATTTATSSSQLSATSSRLGDGDGDDESDDAPEGESDGRPAGVSSGEVSPEKPLPRMAAAFTPRRGYGMVEDEERLTSSALRGGAANGLLSLSLAGR